jgi:hypothetical protein
VAKLLKEQHSSEVDVVMDASFIKAWSIPHPTDNQTGFSDADARVGRPGRFFALGYKLHLSIDHKTMLPLSSVFASANQNEKKHSLTILDKAKRILQRCKAKDKRVVADSQYSGSKLRDAVEKATIPYPLRRRKVKSSLGSSIGFRFLINQMPLINCPSTYPHNEQNKSIFLFFHIPPSLC